MRLAIAVIVVLAGTGGTSANETELTTRHLRRRPARSAIAWHSHSGTRRSRRPRSPGSCHRRWLRLRRCPQMNTPQEHTAYCPTWILLSPQGDSLLGSGRTVSDVIGEAPKHFKVRAERVDCRHLRRATGAVQQ